MPRSLPFRNRWRFVLMALVILAPVSLTLWRAGAQRNRTAQQPGAQQQQGAQRKNITPLRASETPEGSRIMITSDGALNDYSAYRSGERFYVLLPAADAPRVLSGLRGRGFDDVRVQKRGNDVLLSFRLLSGATARVSQKFNRLEVLITIPSLVAANNTANANARPQPTPRTQPTPVNPNFPNTNTRTQPNTVNNNSSSAVGQANINSGNPIGPNTPGITPQGTGTRQSPTGTGNPAFTNPPAGIPVGPDGVTPSTGTEGFQADAQASPTPFPSVTPPSDQIAQVQPTPGIPTTTGPPINTTSAPAPVSGTSLGAQLKQNWLFVLLGLAIVGLIAWVLVARSRADRSPVERRVETLRESKAERIVEAAPAKAKPLKAEPVKAKPEKAKPEKVATAKAKPAKVADKVADKVVPEKIAPEKVIAERDVVADLPVVAPIVTPPPAEVEPVEAKSVVAPVALVQEPVEETSSAPVAEAAPEAKEIAPVRPVEVEQASDEVANLLAGHRYDESVISTQEFGARQIITAELVAALAGRNPARHERAREAFINHGYFDEATQTLRTAESPAERASAARSLGLVRDHAATPHLVAALEDASPEVRRAAVESLAEVRDSAAVAPLEALRDREKDRRIPVALIQHAIEASVVGRVKAEPTAPVQPPATTPLAEAPALETDASHAVETPAQLVEAEAPVLIEEPAAIEEPAKEELAAEPAVEAAVEAAPEFAVETPAAIVEESAAAVEEPVAEEATAVSETTLETEAVTPPLIAEEVAPEIVPEQIAPVVEEPAQVEEAAPVALAETGVVEEAATEVIAEEAAPAEAIAPVPEEVPAPVATAEPVIEYNDGTASGWVDVDMSQQEPEPAPPVMPIAPVVDEASVTEAPAEITAQVVSEEAAPAVEAAPVVEVAPEVVAPVIAPVVTETGVEPVAAAPETGLDVPSESRELDVAEDDLSSVPSAVMRRLASEDAAERAGAVAELGRLGGEDSFREISASFDDPSQDVRNAAARALFNLNPDRAASFTRALREAPPERRRHIGSALASSGLATEAIGHLMGESREKTYDAFSLLFLMSKAGEVQPLMRAVEEHPNNEVRLAVVKLLALSGQQEILPAFRRLAVRGSLPTEVRSAVMEAIYQISSQTPDAASRS